MSATYGSPRPLAPDLTAPPYAGAVTPELPTLLRPLLGEAAAPGRDVFILLDGVGLEQLTDHRALTPTLRRLAGEIRPIRTVLPATTATAMTSLLTGLAPLMHGVLGYETFDPGTGAAINQLQGERRIDPRAWMPCPTLGETSGRRAIHVGPAAHRRSFLTRSAFRGWEFAEHANRQDRVEAVLRALRRSGPDALVHLHVDDVDRAGHRYGVDSEPWREALAEADAILGTLLRRLPRGTRIHVTADHGMVDTAPEWTVDLAQDPWLASRIRAVAGEPRARMLRIASADGTVSDVLTGLRDRLGERAVVLDHAQILDSGLLGPRDANVPDHVPGRIGDALVLARGRHAVVDSRFTRTDVPPEIGVHGSATDTETLVPLLQLES